MSTCMLYKNRNTKFLYIVDEENDDGNYNKDKKYEMISFDTHDMQRDFKKAIDLINNVILSNPGITIAPDGDQIREVLPLLNINNNNTICMSFVDIIANFDLLEKKQYMVEMYDCIDEDKDNVVDIFNRLYNAKIDIDVKNDRILDFLRDYKYHENIKCIFIYNNKVEVKFSHKLDLHSLVIFDNKTCKVDETSNIFIEINSLQSLTLSNTWVELIPDWFIPEVTILGIDPINCDLDKIFSIKTNSLHLEFKPAFTTQEIIDDFCNAVIKCIPNCYAHTIGDEIGCNIHQKGASYDRMMEAIENHNNKPKFSKVKAIVE